MGTAMSDLETLIPQAVELVIDGEPLAIKPLKVGQMPAFLRSCPIWRNREVAEDPAQAKIHFRRHRIGQRPRMQKLDLRLCHSKP